MKRYLKLVHMEIHRFRFVLAALMGITAVFQISSFVSTLLRELSLVELEERDPARNPFSFALSIANSQFWSIIPILLCVAVLALYVFLIWYRDWVGRSTFIYRLLMLPTARRHIYLAKGTAILLFVFSLLSFQLLLLLIQSMLFNMIVPSEWRVDSFFAEVLRANQALELLLPLNFEQFIYSYGLGMIAVFAIFTAILLERSYRGIGILYGIGYLAACVVVVILPLLILEMDGNYAYLYPGEMLAMESALCILLPVASLFLGFRLLSKKISV